MKQVLVFISVALAVTVALVAADAGGGDWPMWGGTPDRNMVSLMKGLPTSWDIKTKKNVKWVAKLGSQSYGNVTVAGGIGPMILEAIERLFVVGRVRGGGRHLAVVITHQLRSVIVIRVLGF